MTTLANKERPESGRHATRSTTPALSDRQRAYLLAVFTEDRVREGSRRGPRATPAATWRWIEYGPVGAKWLDNPSSAMLRSKLMRAGLVNRGTGASWAALARAGLIERKHAHTGLVDVRTCRPVLSLFIRLTRAGRKLARELSGAPQPPQRSVKPLSLSALWLIAYGQANPGATFEWCSPWDGRARVPDYLMLLGVARGLVKLGLLAGEPPHDLRITDAGRALDVSAEPNWRPLAGRIDRGW